MDKFTKRSSIIMIVISVIFILLIPLEVFVMNKTDTINTQLLLMQAAGDAGYTQLMTVKTWLKVAIGIISVLKILAGILMILLGATVLNRSKTNKAKKTEIKEIEKDNKGELHE